MVEYPVVIDSDFAIWRAFDNHYWPALYFIDAHGHLRHHQFGEGEYEASERMIQQLLTEAGAAGVGHDLVAVDASGAEAAADWGSLESPETYVGYDRASNFASPGGAVLDRRHEYDDPGALTAAITGRSPATGRCSPSPPCSAPQTAVSRTAFTPAT